VNLHGTKPSIESKIYVSPNNNTKESNVVNPKVINNKSIEDEYSYNVQKLPKIDERNLIPLQDVGIVLRAKIENEKYFIEFPFNKKLH